MSCIWKAVSVSIVLIVLILVYVLKAVFCDSKAEWGISNLIIK